MIRRINLQYVWRVQVRYRRGRGKWYDHLAYPKKPLAYAQAETTFAEGRWEVRVVRRRESVMKTWKRAPGGMPCR